MGKIAYKGLYLEFIPNTLRWRLDESEDESTHAWTIDAEKYSLNDFLEYIMKEEDFQYYYTKKHGKRFEVTI